MTSTSIIHQGPSPDQDDFGLSAIAKHNAQTFTEQFPAYHDDAKGLGIYQDGYGQVYSDEPSYVHNPPTPRSNTASDGVRTRSGCSARRTDSPFSTSKSRVSKSPAARSKKDKKSKLDKSKTPKLTAPLSVLTKDMTVPVRDIDAWINRSIEERLKEVEKKGGYITRPMNSFMLYRSAYAERTKQWCLQNNHQIVSSVSGESWPMESPEVRKQFEEWAKTERQHHHEAHPNYKFSPSKSTDKRRKGEFSEDEDERSDLEERNPDGDYRGGRNVRQRRQEREPAYLPSNVGLESHPYYDQQLSGYEQSQYQCANPGRPLPLNIVYDQYGQAYDARTNTYVHACHQYQQNPYIPDVHGAPRVPTPASLNGQQSLGGYGLPGGQATEDIFSNSRTSTPMQHYQNYGQPVYPQYQTQYQQPTYHSVSASATPQPGTQQYEHAQYLTQPQESIDPALQAMLEASGAVPGGQPAETHFDDALGDLGTNDLGGMPAPEYYTNPSPADVHATLAPTWSPTQYLN